MLSWIPRSRSFAALAASAGLAIAALPAQAKETAGGAEVAAAGAYVPPPRGAPGRRIGGGTRSAGEAPVAALTSLVPDGHVGLTGRAQPIVMWHLSADTEARIDFTLTRSDATEPVLERTLSGPFEAGIHATSLAELGAELETGSRYQWFVAIVVDPERRSKDVVAGGPIERASGSGGAGDAAALAQAGLWYDALAHADATFRASLLRQVGLDQAAAAPMAR